MKESPLTYRSVSRVSPGKSGMGPGKRFVEDGLSRTSEHPFAMLARKRALRPVVGLLAVGLVAVLAVLAFVSDGTDARRAGRGPRPLGPRGAALRSACSRSRRPRRASRRAHTRSAERRRRRSVCSQWGTVHRTVGARLKSCSWN